ncbi:MAG: GAF domain-containing protein [Bacteroidales bacterium]|nr:GAF domain-containing protein [Bacteroidales bacterium]MDG2080351.1 GAF domain-containing protein [Bacteroidales bacterium]
MDRIDVLGDSNERFGLFTKELLAETNDSELQKIVKKAAADLNSPIALVSLVLDQVQFFKAHIGLPPVLAKARGTHRDVSFCQFVVRDGETFEVNDASNDPRIPQHVVKEYNIQSYLGVPIMVKENVMGSLCVLDTKKRGFSKEEHTSLKKLAKLVNGRLEAIAKSRRQTRLDLTEYTLKPALSELSNSLKSIQNFIKSSYSAETSIRTFLNHSNHLFSNESQYSEAIRFSLEAATKGNQLNEDLLLEIEFAVIDSIDCVNALEQIVNNIESTKLSKIVVSAQDLSRNATKLIGGFPLPDFESDPKIYTQGNLAIAIVTNCLLIISSELGKSGSKNGIRLDTNESDEFIELTFSAKDLTQSSTEMVINDLNNLIGTDDPTIRVDLIDEKIRLNFSTVN